jgi:iron complex outermembrane recepter protein
MNSIQRISRRGLPAFRVTVGAAMTLVAALGACARASAQQDTSSETPSNSSTTLPLVKIAGESPYPEASGYLATTANSTTRTAVPIQDQAASIQVVPQQVLQDRAVIRIDQTIENVSGVLPESDYGGNGATFFNIRGFSENNSLRDGFRNFGYFAFRDVQAIERVEIYKGPAGALSGGVGAVGGYVNTVSKRPDGSNAIEASLTGGSDGFSRATVDADRALGQDVAVRLNLAAEHNDSFRDNGGHSAWSVAPALRWRLGAGTSLTLLTEFNHLQRDGFDFGLPAVANYRQLSRTRYYGLADGMYDGVAGDYGKNDTQSVTALFDHALNDEWTLHLSASYVDAHQRSTQSFPDSTTATDGLLNFTVYEGANEESRQTTLRAELEGRLMLGGMRHTVLAGVDNGYLEQGGKGSTSYAMTLDLSDASYRSGLTYVGVNASHQGQGKDAGIYVNDQIDLSPQWKAFVALRGDRFSNRALVSNAETGHNTETAFSPRVGLVWQPVTSTSFFADWSRSHAPNVGHGANENTFAAEIAAQVEAGVKQQFFDKRLQGSLVWFKLDRSNILTTDPDDATKEVLTGKESSQGVEADLAGQITPAWKLMASYTYTDAVVKSDTDIPVGDQLSNVPHHHASLWSTYDMAAVPGLGVGAGLYYVGEREATLPNTFKLPAYVRTDAALYYRRDAWRLQLNIDNLFDRKYVTGGSASTFNYMLVPSDPRTVKVTASYRF